MNPELRQTLQTISRNIESANETAQENIYTFSQNYVDPCFASVRSCFTACVEPCFPSSEGRKRRRRGQSRGRAELSFDFYDDWDDEFGDDEARERDALLGWGNDRLDRLLAGNQQVQDHRKRGTDAKQPRRQRAMNYGTKGRRSALPQEHGPDPTVIPGSAYLGFLERLPWRIGRRGLRYRPSAADLQEHPGGDWISHEETQPLVETSEEEDDQPQPPTKPTGRKRSETTSSQDTTNSLSSRGDLIPSEDELEADAVPLDDEFAMALERRNTGLMIGGDDRSSGKTGSGKRGSGSRTSTRSVSNKSLASTGAKSHKSGSKIPELTGEEQENEEVAFPIPSPRALKQEEEEAAEEEEAEIQRRRLAAIVLAKDQGLLSAGKVVEELIDDQDDLIPSPGDTSALGAESAGELAEAVHDEPIPPDPNQTDTG